MKTSKLQYALLLGLVPALGGFKCIDYQPPAQPIDAALPEPGGDARTTVDAGDGGGGTVDGTVFVPAVACQQPGIAQFTVENFEYRITCGCKEATGRTCTLPVGTSVTWTFADSEEHNVVSIANSFGMSPLQLSGQFSHTFVTAGTFGYVCSVHSADMSGYQIVVE
jgi:hypothetical protein